MNTYEQEQIANIGEEIAAREYERQREEGHEDVVDKSKLDGMFEDIAESIKNNIGDEIY